jgi:carbonic anhydrase
MSDLNQSAPDMAAIEKFWKAEDKEMGERHRRMTADYSAAKVLMEERRSRRLSIVLTCMDERCALIEDALGLLPGEALVHSSGGGRMETEAFSAVFGSRIIGAQKKGAAVAVWLVTHECVGDENLGCAAFDNNIDAQVDYFITLKKNLSDQYHDAFIHVLALDSTTYAFRRVSVDERDPELARSAVGLKEFAAAEKAHAGYGVYIGDAYRAWVDGHNKYFRLSARNSEIAGNFAIALKVMGHHSKVDLSKMPIVLHVDYPKYANEDDSFAAKDNIDLGVASIMSNDQVKEMLADGRMRLMKTETDIASWQGKLVEG